ncbi:MAG: hypothetical protein PHV43_02645 [Candidatus Colwellbacteria bacterium]|nr:hypothetical protein [Candidatus Colwellbacteria bacterium]
MSKNLEALKNLKEKHYDRASSPMNGLKLLRLTRPFKHTDPEQKKSSGYKLRREGDSNP